MLRNPVNMRVVPIESWWLVSGKRHVVLKSFARTDRALDDLVLMAIRRSVSPVLIDVQRGLIHRLSAAIGAAYPHRTGARGQIVSDCNDQVITRIHLQGWVLETVRGHKTEELSIGGIDDVLIRQANRQNALRAG